MSIVEEEKPTSRNWLYRTLQMLALVLPVAVVIIAYPIYEAMFPDGYGTPKFIQISVGLRHSCGITADRLVKCWGENKFGQIGQPVTSRNFLAPMLVPGLEDIQQISVAGDFSCAVLFDGTVKCWGGNHLGQLGNEEFVDSQVPVTVHGLKSVSSLVTTPDSACAIDESFDVRCWGAKEISFINADPMLAHTRQLAIGRSHACALDLSGRATCWGDNQFGLRTPSSGRRGEQVIDTSPRRIAGIEKAKFIVAGNRHNCVITSSDTVACWGDNSDGALGTSDLPFSLIPIEIRNLKNVISLATSGSETCALTASGQMRCWGDGRVVTPPVALNAVSELKIGLNHGCVLHADGLTACWGSNLFGALGNNSWESESPLPVPVSNSNFVKQAFSLLALQARLATTQQE